MDESQFSPVVFGALLQDETPAFHSYYNDEFHQESLLHHGDCGTIYKVTNKLDGQQYTAKRVPIRKDTVRRLCLDEVRILATVRHPNVARYFRSWIETPPAGFLYPGESVELLTDSHNDQGDGDNMESDDFDSDDSYDDAVVQESPSYERLFIQMEPLSESLRDFLLRRNQRLVEGVLANAGFDEALNIYHQLADGIDYIHTRGLSHGALTTENVFLTAGRTVKVCYVSEDLKHRKKDIYNLGVILFELVYPMRTAQQRVFALRELDLGNFPDKFKAPFSCRYAIQQMLNKEKEARRLVSRPRSSLRWQNLVVTVFCGFLLIVLFLYIFFNWNWSAMARKFTIWKICMENM